MDAETSSGVVRESKGCISTSTNLAYDQVEGVKAAEYEMCAEYDICRAPAGALQISATVGVRCVMNENADIESCCVSIVMVLNKVLQEQLDTVSLLSVQVV